MGLSAYVRRDEEAQGAGLGEESVRVDREDDRVNLNSFGLASEFLRIAFSSSRATYHFALEGTPDHGAVADDELGQAASGENLALRNVEGVHDGDDVVAALAGSLNISQQLRGDQVVHVLPKVGRVQGDPALEVVEEEHVWGGTGLFVRFVCVLVLDTSSYSASRSSRLSGSGVLSFAIVCDDDTRWAFGLARELEGRSF